MIARLGEAFQLSGMIVPTVKLTTADGGGQLGVEIVAHLAGAIVWPSIVICNNDNVDIGISLPQEALNGQTVFIYTTARMIWLSSWATGGLQYSDSWRGRDESVHVASYTCVFCVFWDNWWFCRDTRQ